MFPPASKLGYWLHSQTVYRQNFPQGDMGSAARKHGTSTVPVNSTTNNNDTQSKNSQYDPHSHTLFVYLRRHTQGPQHDQFLGLAGTC